MKRMFNQLRKSPSTCNELPSSVTDINKQISGVPSDLIESRSFTYPSDKEAVEILLNKGADINLPDIDGWTPLMIASNKGHKEEVGILLDKGADVNLPDKDGWTPLRLALQKGYKDVVEILLDRGANVAHSDQHKQTPFIWSSDEAMARSTYMPKCQDDLSQYDDTDSCGLTLNKYKLKLPRKRTSTVVDDLGALEAKTNLSKIHEVYKTGQWELLEELLMARRQNSWKPVKLLDFISYLMEASNPDQELHETITKNVNFGKCVDLLIEYAEYDVNEQNVDGYSALHLAGLYNRTESILVLLEKGAYIGSQDKTGRPVIWIIPAETLSLHFDRCIKKGSIKMHFNNLICPPENKVNLENGDSLSQRERPSDMCAIQFMANSDEHKDLIEHPLFDVFLEIKWKLLPDIFYFDICLYFLFWIMSGYMSVYYVSGSEKKPSGGYVSLYTTMIMSIIYIIGREIMRGRYSMNYYRRYSFLNTIVTVLFLSFFVIFIPLQYNPALVVAVYLILTTYKAFTMIKLVFWDISIYADMYLEVVRRTIGSLELYVIFLPAFSALCYVLLQNPSIDHETSKNGDQTCPELNYSPSFLTTIIEVLVMTVGEIDSNLISRLATNSFSTVILLAFMLFILITFVNLINALVFNDINLLKKTVTTKRIKERIELLLLYEETSKLHENDVIIKWIARTKILSKFTEILAPVVCWAFEPFHIDNSSKIFQENKKIYIKTNDKYERLDDKIYWDDSFSDSRSAKIAIPITKIAESLMKRDLEDESLGNLYDMNENVAENETNARILRIEETVSSLASDTKQIKEALAQISSRIQEQITN